MTNEINLINQDGKVLVSSRVVANDFGKRHAHVLEKIEQKLTNRKIGSLNYFIESTYIDSKGETRKEYLLTRDGFAFIVMGFTGEKADEFKLKYIEAFNKMEQMIKNQVPQLSDRDNAILMVMNSTSDIERVESLKHFESIVTKPLLATIEEQKPCVDYVDAVLSQKDSILVRQVCKIAYTKNQIEIGEKKLYSLLRHWGWICKNSTEPTQKALNSDYVEIESKIIHTAYGDREVYTTMIKPKGQVYIVQKLATMTIQEVNEIHKSITKTSKF